jgi:hypothetical protein
LSLWDFLHFKEQHNALNLLFLSHLQLSFASCPKLTSGNH